MSSYGSLYLCIIIFLTALSTAFCTVHASFRSTLRDPERPRIYLDEVDDSMEDVIVEPSIGTTVPRHSGQRNLSILAQLSPRVHITLVGCIVLTTASITIGARGFFVRRWITEGDQLLSAHNYEMAELLYRDALMADPQLHSVHAQLARALLARSRLREAVMEATIASKTDADDITAHVLLGDVLEQLKRKDEAAREYRSAVALNPASSDSHLRYGIALADGGKTTEGLSELRYAVSLSPGNAEANSRLGALLLQTGARRDGITFLQCAVALEPDSVEARERLATGYLQCGMNSAAVVEYRTELKRDPERAESYYYLGQALYRLNNREGALDAYRSYLRTDNGASESLPRHEQVRMEVNRLLKSRRNSQLKP